MEILELKSINTISITNFANSLTVNKVYLNNTTLEDFNTIWYNYFDLGRDYTQIKKELKSMDEYLDKACDFGYGIRILQQDGWEMLISFIISNLNRYSSLVHTTIPGCVT